MEQQAKRTETEIHVNEEMGQREYRFPLMLLPLPINATE